MSVSTGQRGRSSNGAATSVDASVSGFEKGDREYRRLLLAMFGAGFATFTQLFGVQGLLPFIASEEHLTADAAAMALSVASLGMAVGVLPWSVVADRVGRVRTMVIALAASSVFGAIAPFVAPYEAFLVLRFLTGLALAAVPAVAMAFITEVVSPRWTAAAAGTFVAGNSIGGIAGRVVSGTVASLTDWRVSLLVVSALAVLAGVLFVVAVPRRAQHTLGERESSGFARRVFVQLRDPYMLAFYTQGLLLMGAFGAMYNYLSFRLAAEPFAVPEVFLSFIFVVYIAGTITARCSGWVAARTGVLGAFLLATLTMLVGTALTLSDNLAVVITGLVVFTAGCFLAHPLAGSQAAQQALTGRGQASALYQLSWLAGTAVFGWLGGVVYEAHGWFGISVLFAAMLATSATICSLALTIGTRHRPRI